MNVKTKSLQIFCWLFVSLLSLTATGQPAKWITKSNFEHTSNQWIKFRKEITLAEKPSSAIAEIAVDSKYWLWVNGKLVVFEGQLKRGPNPQDTYCDKLDLAPWLKKGENTIAILLWYFGKEGFSHKDSGMAGLYFDCHYGSNSIVSDSTWKYKFAEEFKRASGEEPNWRLPESNVQYVASLEEKGWNHPRFNDSKWNSAVEVAIKGGAPWNKLVTRSIPLFTTYDLVKVKHITQEGNRMIMSLPYNMQFHPWIKVKGTAGKKVSITTDNYYKINGKILRAEYITKEGEQEYLHLPWLNGHKVFFELEEGIELVEAGYMESGYSTKLDGLFEYDDKDLLTLVEKAKRTLYVTMRDNFMDCPDRERAQWWGDLVLEMEETFYAMDNDALDLSRKAIYELVDWQKESGVLYSPTPAGNWHKELPQQMLASVGWFGFRHFAHYTGELEIYKKVFPRVKKYLSLWNIGSDGSVPFKKGGWNWSDWGKQVDIDLLEHVWYYLALKGYVEMAHYLGETHEQQLALTKMEQIKHRLNTEFWTSEGYRSPSYKEEIDDRGNGLAVVAGIADESKYPVLKHLLINIRHASPYMEKYVEEALFMMDEHELALKRMKERYQPMIDSELTTLWEVFQNGGWSYNHAWSGGPLSLLYKYIAGIVPTKPGFEEFSCFPNLVGKDQVKCSFSTVRGNISMKFEHKGKQTQLRVEVPESSSAIIRIPVGASKLSFNHQKDYKKVEYDASTKYNYYKLSAGSWSVSYK